MRPFPRVPAWKALLWRLFPPSKICLRSRHVWMFSYPYTVEDWARELDPEYNAYTIGKSWLERQTYFYWLYRDKLAFPYHGVITLQTSEEIEQEARMLAEWGNKLWVGPMTPEEIQRVRDWVASGTPSTKPVAPDSPNVDQ